MDMINRDQIISWIVNYVKLINENKDFLTKLDLEIGDGDHGTNMQRGMSKVIEGIEMYKDRSIYDILNYVGKTLMSTVGGASGPLYSLLFIKGSQAVKDKQCISLEDLINFFNIGLNSIESFGGADIGSKTMIDSLSPALDALKENRYKSLPEALNSAAEAALNGSKITIPLVAKKGRASYLGERSKGHQDPGSYSMYLLFDALKEVFSK